MLDYLSPPDVGHLLLAAGYSLELVHHATSDLRRWRQDKKSGCLMLRRMLMDLVMLGGLTLVLVGYIAIHAAGRH